MPKDNTASRTEVPGVARAQTEGPAVLAQPTSDTFPFPKSSESGGDAPRGKEPITGPTKGVISGRLADARDAAVSTYRHASDTTDQYVHQRPWNSIALAALGGVLVGMLAAR